MENILKNLEASILRATFIGYFIRSFIFLYMGFNEAGAYQTFIKDTQSIESFMKIGSLVPVIAFVLFIYVIRKKEIKIAV